MNAASIKVVGVASNSRRHNGTAPACRIDYRLPHVPARTGPVRPVPARCSGHLSRAAGDCHCQRNKWINSDRLDLEQFTQLIHVTAFFSFHFAHVVQILGAVVAVFTHSRTAVILLYTFRVLMIDDVSAWRNHVN